MMADTLDVIAVAALIVAFGAFLVALAVAGWWYARSLTALAAGALNLKQVAAVDTGVKETDPVPIIAPEPVAPGGRINTRNRMSTMSDDDLAAAAQDVKVITFDDNNGIDGDVAPIPKGGRGVYASR